MCSDCSQWRIISFEDAAAVGEDDAWTCAMLDPPHSSCATPHTRVETLFDYVPGGARGQPQIGADPGQTEAAGR